MTSYNAANERIKRQYFAYLAEAQGYSEQTIDAVAKAIARFEAYTRYKDFKSFHIEQAKAFKHDLADQRGCRSSASSCKTSIPSRAPAPAVVYSSICLSPVALPNEAYGTFPIIRWMPSGFPAALSMNSIGFQNSRRMR
jgi:hypothetical protein